MSKLAAFIFIAICSLGAAAQKNLSAGDIEKIGNKHFAEGKIDQAISDFTLLIEITSSLDSKPISKTSVKDKAPAFADDERENVRVIDPRTAQAYVYRGRAYMVKGDRESAIEDFNRATRI